MDLEIEKRLWAEGYRLIAGVDEAGRGPLAGPVVAAAVILPLCVDGCSSIAKKVKDSKKLSSKVREDLFREISEKAAVVGVGIATHEEIDKINILQASLLAMRRAIEKFKKKPDYIIVDGNRIPFDPGHKVPQKAIIKGDSLSPSIAAASIIAKVTRDHIMEDMAVRYPAYKFEIHKGYPTREHIGLLQKYGPCPIHRLSFSPVKEALNRN